MEDKFEDITSSAAQRENNKNGMIKKKKKQTMKMKEFSMHPTESQKERTL